MKQAPINWVYSREFREQYLELSQAELSTALGLSTNTISKWDQEIRYPSDENLQAIEKLMENEGE